MNRTALLLMTLIAAIVGGTLFALSQRNQVSTQSALALPTPATKLTATSPISLVQTSKSTHPSFKISGCNGSSAHANFRQFPSLAPGSILGVVTIGQFVQIAPHPVQAEGLVWYQATNLAPLAPSTEATAQNQLQAGQVGWIAGCFVQGSPVAAAVPNPRSSL